MSERQRGNDIGPTAAIVAENLRIMRRVRRMSISDLEIKLQEQGRPIPWASLSRIEHSLRRIDVDDLVHLASALNIEPGQLLEPIVNL